MQSEIINDIDTNEILSLKDLKELMIICDNQLDNKQRQKTIDIIRQQIINRSK